MIAEVAACLAAGLRPAQVEARLRHLTVAWLAVLAAGLAWLLWLGDAQGFRKIAELSWVESQRSAINAFSDGIKYPFHAFFLIILILGWRLRRRALTVAATGYLIAQLIGSLLIVRLLKMALGHQRPSTGELGDAGGQWLGPTLDPSYHGFPSGHTAETVTSVLFIAMILSHRGLWPLWLAIAVAAGLSRLGVYAHYPSDVVGGALLAGLVTLLTAHLWMLPRLRQVKLEAEDEGGAVLE